MRAREIIQENYQESLESDLGNILVGAKGAGATDIETADLVQQLQGMGYAVDANSLMILLSRNPMVLNATPQMVKMTGPEGAGANAGQAQDSASRVTDMAQKANSIK